MLIFKLSASLQVCPSSPEPLACVTNTRGDASDPSKGPETFPKAVMSPLLAGALELMPDPPSPAVSIYYATQPRGPSERACLARGSSGGGT